MTGMSIKNQFLDVSKPRCDPILTFRSCPKFLMENDFRLNRKRASE
jgi:hypothetical protein